MIAAWHNDHIDDYMAYVRGHGEKSPFDLPTDPENYVCLQENDYLRLSRHPKVRDAHIHAATEHGLGKMSAGVFAGRGGANESFCRKIAECMKAETAVLTTAGWTANAGLLEAITPPGRPIYLDAKVHASLWDGARLSQGRPTPVNHNDPAHLARKIERYGPGVVVLDAFYSTDGSVVELAGFVEVCRAHDCVIVLDEAHSFGITGEKGGGLAVELGLQDRIAYRTASLSKALGGHGGFIAGCRRLIEHLRYRCRSILFSSSTAEIIGAGNCAALELVMEDPSRGRVCLEMAGLLRRELNNRGISTGDSRCQIVSVTLFGCYSASKLYWALREKHGVLGSVFAYPATPRSKSLLRFSVHSQMTEADVTRVAESTAECIELLGLSDRVATDRSEHGCAGLADPSRAVA